MQRRGVFGRKAGLGKTGHLLGTCAVLGLLAAVPAWAAPDADAVQLAQAGTKRFDIPTLPLADALMAFGIQSGLQVSVDTALLAGLRSPGVQGPQTPERALAALLAGTGMTWRFSSANTVVVERGAASSSVTMPSPSATVAAAPLVLDPVTVAGERVERSLRDTASSVSVVDAKTIDAQPGLTGTNKVMESLANVVAVEPSNYAPVIRGVDGSGAAVGATAFFAGVRPRLTTQVDGRAASFNEMIFGDVSMWDVEQIEVFRGPQSTVQGRNSIAGAVVVKTKDPTFAPEAKARAIVGNHDTRQYSGMVSGPVVEDQVAVRVAVDRWTSVSELPFTAYQGEADPEDYQSTTLRAKLLLEPKKLDGLRALLTLNHSNYEGPQGEMVKYPFGDGVPQNANVSTFNPRSTSGILDTTWVLTDSLTWENRLTLTDFSVRRHSAPSTGNLEISGNEGSLEPRLRFSALDDHLTGFGGYYGLRSQQTEYIDLWGGHGYSDKTSTDALFGEATLNVADRYDLTAGMRFEQEDRDREGGSGNYALNFHETYKTFLPKLGAAWHVTENATVGAVVSRGYNGGGAGMTFAAPFMTYTYEPEYVWNYETYGRVDLMGGALRLNGNLFYADYKNMQLPVSIGTNSSVIRNANEAVTYGAEIGARWKALQELELSGEIGLLKTEVVRYSGSGLEGNDLPHAPALTATFGALYRPIEDLDLGIDARYSEAYYTEVTNAPRGKTDPYWVVNARASYDLGGPRVFGYVNNLFDTDTPIDIFASTTQSADYAIMLRPRTFGLGVEMSF